MERTETPIIRTYLKRFDDERIKMKDQPITIDSNTITIVSEPEVFISINGKYFLFNTTKYQLTKWNKLIYFVIS